MWTFKTPSLVRKKRQHGVLLVVVLIMLAVLSILASVSIRGASSSEQVANQARLKNLAQQAAEAALRFCETQVQANAIDNTKGFAPQAAPVGAPLVYSWQTMGNWDDIDSATNPFVATGNLKVVNFTASGDTGSATYFKRSPECMSQYMTVANTKLFVTTARGFGPDVGAKDGKAPIGTEVWLQSVVTLK